MGPWGSWGLDFTIPPSWGDFSAGLGHLHPIHSASGNLSNQWMNLPSVSSLTTIIYRKKIGQKWWNDFNEILIKWAIMFSPEIILFHRAISGPTLSQPVRLCRFTSFTPSLRAFITQAWNTKQEQDLGQQILGLICPEVWNREVWLPPLCVVSERRR